MTKTIHVLLVDHFADWEPALLLCELARQGGWQTVTLGLERGRVRSLGGLVTEVEHGLADVDPGSVGALVVVGSPKWEQGEIPAISRFLRAAWDAGATVGAICGATLAAGHAGLLAGRRFSSNEPGFVSTHVTGQPLGSYVDALATRDGRLVTASGMGYIDFAAELLVALGVLPEGERDGWATYVRHGGRGLA